MWRNDIKCKYMFLFSLNNLARKGLKHWFGFVPSELPKIFQQHAFLSVTEQVNIFTTDTFVIYVIYINIIVINGRNKQRKLLAFVALCWDCIFFTMREYQRTISARVVFPSSRYIAGNSIIYITTHTSSGIHRLKLYIQNSARLSHIAISWCAW